MQLFTLLGYKTNGPTGKTKENVTLKDFLDKAEAVVKNGPAIKALDAQVCTPAPVMSALCLQMDNKAKRNLLQCRTVMFHGQGQTCPVPWMPPDPMPRSHLWRANCRHAAPSFDKARSRSVLSLGCLLIPCLCPTCGAQAQGEAVIRKALAELKIWGLQREFSLAASSSTVGTKTRTTTLIKEWRDVMAEVADHQSLVSSLRQSNYFHLFKDEVRRADNFMCA